MLLLLCMTFVIFGEIYITNLHDECWQDDLVLPSTDLLPLQLNLQTGFLSLLWKQHLEMEMNSSSLIAIHQGHLSQSKFCLWVPRQQLWGQIK